MSFPQDKNTGMWFSAQVHYGRCDSNSDTHRSASSMGSRLRSAVSLGSLNHDFMGIALSAGQTGVHTQTGSEVNCDILGTDEGSVRTASPVHLQVVEGGLGGTHLGGPCRLLASCPG